MNAPAAAQDFDVAIVGGGLVGASLALALADTALRIALIEPVLPGEGSQPSFDDRCSALANGSRRILESIGVWSGIARLASPIRCIQISDAGRFGAARLSAEEQGLEALGYTVLNRQLGAALWQRLHSQHSIVVLAPARVTAVNHQPDCVQLQVTGADGVRLLHTRLAVAADGAQLPGYSHVLHAGSGLLPRNSQHRKVALIGSNSGVERYDQYARQYITQRFGLHHND